MLLHSLGYLQWGGKACNLARHLRCIRVGSCSLIGLLWDLSLMGQQRCNFGTQQLQVLVPYETACASIRQHL